MSIDRGYPDAHIARGLALISLGRVPDGLAALKRGLLRMQDPDRAAAIVRGQYLEPNDP